MPPTTGNEGLDKVVREQMTEAIGIAYQVISDLAPDLPQDIKDRMAAVIVSQVWMPLALLVVKGTQVVTEEEVI